MTLEDSNAAASPTRTAHIVRRLEEEIALGRLRPRERLLEDELAAHFDAKRHVVRQALAELEVMGIVIRQPNKGAAVRDFSAGEIEQIYLVRELVERQAAMLIPLPADPGLIARLKDIHVRHCAAAQRGDLRTVFRENLAFHRTFFAACGNPHLVEVIEQFAYKAHAIRSYTIGDPQLLARVCDEHARIIECLETRARKALIDLVAEHIQPAKEAYLKLARNAGAHPFKPPVAGDPGAR